MDSVHLSFGGKDKIVQHARAGEDSYCYPELVLTDRTDAGADQIQLQYEDLASVFARELLATLYGLAADRVFRLPHPRTVAVERGSDSLQYEANHPPIAKPDRGTVIVAITEDDVSTDERGYPTWDPDHLSATIEVDVEHFVSEIVSAADEYVSLVRNHWPNEWHDERLLTLRDDGQSIRNYVEKHGSATGFALNPASERTRRYLYKVEYEEPALSRFLIETGTLRAAIDHLREQDDEEAQTNYQVLLSHPSDAVRREVLRILNETPDERAKQPLIGQRWEDDPELVPLALEAAARVGGTDVRDALLDTLEFSNEPRIRETAVNELAAFDDDDEVADSLVTAAEADESERVRAAARHVLSEQDR